MWGMGKIDKWIFSDRLKFVTIFVICDGFSDRFQSITNLSLF